MASPGQGPLGEGLGCQGWVPKPSGLLGVSAGGHCSHHGFAHIWQIPVVCQLSEVMPPAAQTPCVPLPPLQRRWVTRPLAEQTPVCGQPAATATAWLVTPWEGELLERAERELLEGSSCKPFMGMMLFQAFPFSGLSSRV